ncbi:MAG: hypothetical protein NTY08_10160 [Proteobacteria bacterium]|nr:hypothetical protein [Pseudomonadota bacterium]
MDRDQVGSVGIIVAVSVTGGQIYVPAVGALAAADSRGFFTRGKLKVPL